MTDLTAADAGQRRSEADLDADKVSLATIARQQASFLREQRQAHASERVTQAVLGRLDMTIQALTAELRAIREQQLLQTDQLRDDEVRLGRLEDHAPT